MSDYNPHSTGTKGVEWFPTVEGGITLDALTKSACMSILQTTSQAIGTVRPYVGAIPTRGGLYVCEVFDGETAVPATPTTLTARPNEDVSGTGALPAWCEDDGTTTTIYTEIDETTLDLTDYIRGRNTSSLPAGTDAYVGRMGTGALTLTSKRILSVRVVAVCAYIADTLNPSINGYMAVGLDLSGSRYFGTVKLITTAHGSGTTTVDNVWYYNPSTKKPWTIAEVQALDTTDEWILAINGYTLPATDIQMLCYQAYLEIVVCDENRLAVGILDDTASALTPDAWNAITLTTPTGGTWTKDAAGYHLYLLRRLSSTGALVIPTLDSGTAPNPARSYLPTLDPAYGYATVMGSALSKVFGLIQRTTAPAESVDSQPYVALVAATVKTGQNAEQEFSNAAVAAYGGVLALVQPGTATASLLVKLKKRSDSSQLGATITLTPAQALALDDEGSGWRLLDQQMSSLATLATGTQYYVEFSSTDAVGWTVLCLDTGDQGNGAGFGGTTDRATINGGEADRYDIPVTIGSIPSAPTGFAATVLDQAI